MRLVNAMAVFATSTYLKLFALACPLCLVWQYFDSARHAHLVLAELVLVLAIGAITLGSLCLARMDCQRISNYLLAPALLGLVYLNLTHHQRETWPTSGRAPANSLADTLELFLCNRLAALSVVLMATNAFSEQIDKIIS